MDAGPRRFTRIGDRARLCLRQFGGGRPNGPTLMARGKGKKKGRSGRPTTPLAGHRQQGKLLKPPFLTMPNLKTTHWLADTFPDLLWLCSLISLDNLRGMNACCALLDVVDEVLDQRSARPKGYVADGSLTSLEGVPVDQRDAVLEMLVERGTYTDVVPEPFAHTLGMYPTAPGLWLIDPWRRRGLAINWEEALRFLNRVIGDSEHGQKLVPTRAKFIWLRGLVKAGRLHIPFESYIPDLFSRYPQRITEEERRHTEPMIRATFGATHASAVGKQAGDPQQIMWAQEFWRSNWHKYPCSFRDEPGTPLDQQEMLSTFDQFIPMANDLSKRFLEVALRTDPDLYSPDRYEVLTGITARIVRAVAAAARSPVLWSDEHGSPLLRAAMEAQITLRWLVLNDRREVYERFKAYGRGHLKLHKLHLEEYMDGLEEPREDLARHHGFLEALVNQDLGEEFQEISLEGSFSGIDARRMAQAVGMEAEYKLVFAPASAMAHGEWAALDRYALARCQTPAHRWHRVARPGIPRPSGWDVLSTVMDVADSIVDNYIEAIKTPLSVNDSLKDSQP